MNYISHVYQNNILRVDFKGEIDSSNVVKIKDKINKLRRNYKPNKIERHKAIKSVLEEYNNKTKNNIHNCYDKYCI